MKHSKKWKAATLRELLEEGLERVRKSVDSLKEKHPLWILWDTYNPEWGYGDIDRDDYHWFIQPGIELSCGFCDRDLALDERFVYVETGYCGEYECYTNICLNCVKDIGEGRMIECNQMAEEGKKNPHGYGNPQYRHAQDSL